MIIGRKIPGPAVNARRAEDGKAAIGETATKHIKKTNITMSIIMLVALFDIAAGLDQQFALNKKKLLKGNSNTVDFARVKSPLSFIKYLLFHMRALTGFRELSPFLLLS